MDNQILVVAQTFNTPINLVWRAITEKEIMKKWYFDIPAFELKLGYQFHFEGGEVDNRYLHLCEILEIIPQKKLKYSWQYKGHEGRSYITFELSTNDNKTALKFTHEGIETFTNPDFSRANFVAGWNYLIQKSLLVFLENGEALRYW